MQLPDDKVFAGFGFTKYNKRTRRRAGADDRACLENKYSRKAIRGSNPLASANCLQEVNSMTEIDEQQSKNGESQPFPFNQLEDLLRRGERIDSDTGGDVQIETGDNPLPTENATQ